MATFDFTLDETSVGQMLTPEDGHVTALAMTTPPPYETPEWDAGRRVWKYGYFVLRGQHDLRDLICVQPAVCGHAFSWVGTVANIVVDGNLPYRGGLIVVAVPKNSQWTLTLSDVPNPRVSAAKAPVQVRPGHGRPHLPAKVHAFLDG